jgi:hypothetical protein
MKRRRVLASFALFALAPVPRVLLAQSATKLRRIGCFLAGTAATQGHQTGVVDSLAPSCYGFSSQTSASSRSARSFSL